MTAAASPLSIGATALTGFGKVGAGLFGAEAASQSADQQAQMDEYQAQRLADAKEYALTQASQTDTAMRQQLEGVLGHLMAIRAASETSGPTTDAILARTRGVGEQQNDITVGNLRAQAAESGSEADMYTTAAQQTLAAGQSNALASLFGGILGGGGSLLSSVSGLKLSDVNWSLPNNKNGGLLGFGGNT